jgi:hypothetical protein
MIPWIFIIIGSLLSIGGAIGLLSMLLLPIKERLEIVYNREYDYIRSRTDPDAVNHVRIEKRHLTRDFSIAFIMGIIIFWSGIYLGFAAKGEGFWFYKKFYPEEALGQVWDEINEEGQFVSEDNTAYTYYILVSGSEISLNGKSMNLSEDQSELKAKLSAIQSGNKVMLIDSFAVSSTYHFVKDLLDKNKIDYEETRR